MFTACVFFELGYIRRALSPMRHQIKPRCNAKLGSLFVMLGNPLGISTCVESRHMRASIDFLH